MDATVYAVFVLVGPSTLKAALKQEYLQVKIYWRLPCLCNPEFYWESFSFCDRPNFFHQARSIKIGFMTKGKWFINIYFRVCMVYKIHEIFFKFERTYRPLSSRFITYYLFLDFFLLIILNERRHDQESAENYSFFSQLIMMIWRRMHWHDLI